MKKKIKEFLIKEDDTITAFAITASPAIQVDFIKFSEQELEKINFSIQSEEKQIFAGPLMIPDKLMNRIDEETGEEYLGYFSAETIEKISERFFDKGIQKNINMEHKVPIYSGVSITQAWLIDDDKIDKAFSEKYGYKNLPIGTWMGVMKVFDKELWNELKNSNFKGFSVEGFFLVKDTGKSLNEEMHINKFGEILNDTTISDEDKLSQLTNLMKVMSEFLK